MKASNLTVVLSLETLDTGTANRSASNTIVWSLALTPEPLRTARGGKTGMSISLRSRGHTSTSPWRALKAKAATEVVRKGFALGLNSNKVL